MGILEFLIKHAGKVLEFFGELYDQARQVIKNVWNWLQQWFTLALNFAKKFAKDLFDTAKAEYLKIRDAILKTLVKYADKIWSNVLNEIGKVAAKIQKALDAAKAFAKALANTLRGEFWKLFSAAKSLAENLFKIAWNELLKQASKIAAIGKRVTSISKLIQLDKPHKLNWLLGKAFPFLVDFISNPLKLIVGFWQKHLLTFLEYALAYAIGGHDENLPDWPDFLRR